MPDTELEETHDECGTRLVRTSEDDPANPETCPIVTCPNCLTVVRRER